MAELRIDLTVPLMDEASGAVVMGELAVQAFHEPVCNPAYARPVFRVGKRWLFQPVSQYAPSDGKVWREGDKRQHDAFCLGGVVICEAWKRPKELRERVF